MSLFLFTRKAAVCWSLAASCTTLLTAQTAYVPLGSEQAVPGIIPGDQAHPHLAVSSAGGFLVWDDNATDGDGFGISAVALDTHLQAAQQPFRVNLNAGGDQEYPRVALLKEGGAAFTWLGGQFGFQKIYARFLSSSNTWATADVLVSSASHTAKLAPAIATLANGNVVILWSTFNQRSTSSMQDVYGQLFKPTGAKIGSPFAVNQFSSYNQRTPAVAALPNGGFISAWVSEQQREAISGSADPFVTSKGSVSVDIYARVYDSSATAAAEFVVNTNLVLCANPSIAIAQDGRFIIAWSQGNPESLTNSWDVFARPFSALGVGGTTVRVNTRTLDRQFGPQVACLGNDFLTIWTSSGQDGSGEGVYGQFLDANAQAVGDEFRVNTTRVVNQDQPALASDNFGRFFATWRTGEIEEKLSVEIAGQLYAPPAFEPLALATNYVGPVFAGGSGSDTGSGGNDPAVVSGTPVLDFPLTPSGDVVLADAFAQTKGTYRGLIFNKTAGVRTLDSGYITATATASGGYTVNLKIGAKSYAFSGKFGADGRATYQKTRAVGGTISATLQLDLTGTDQLQGTFSDGTISADFLADRGAYNNTTKRYPNPGVYTFVIEPQTSDTSVPQGSGHGKVTIDAAGKVILLAKLADGTAITQNSALSKTDSWPLYAAPYQSRGRVMSWVQVDSEGAFGELVWIKPASSSAKYYPAGFDAKLDLKGSRYVRPAKSARALDFADGSATLLVSGGGVAADLSLPVYLDLNNRVSDASGSGVKVTISLPNGSFQGSFINPATRKRVSFEGRLLQSDSKGAGFFLNNNLSGKVSLLQ